MGYIVKHEYNCHVYDDFIKSIVENTGGTLLKIGYDTVSFYAPTKKVIQKYRNRYDNIAFQINVGLIQDDGDFTVTEQDYKGWVFYAEYEDKTHKNKDVAHSPERGIPVLQHTTGNVIATFPEQNNPYNNCVAAISRLFIKVIPNDDRLVWSEVSWDYLRECGKRISLQQAMALHPNMFLMGYFEKEKEEEVVTTGN